MREVQALLDSANASRPPHERLSRLGPDILAPRLELGAVVYAALLLAESLAALAWGVRVHSRGFVQLGGLSLVANAIANVIRNVWTYVIIFCGHFTADAETSTTSLRANQRSASTAWHPPARIEEPPLLR